MPSLNKSGKQSQNGIVLLAVIAIATLFFINKPDLFAVIDVFPVSGTFANHTWNGETRLSGCGRAGSVTIGSGIILDFSSFATRNVCSPGGDAHGFASVDIGDFESVEIDFDGVAKGSCVSYGASGTGGFSVGTSAGSLFSKNTVPCVQDSVSTVSTITLRAVKNVAGNVDGFIKECVSCDFRYVGTSPPSSVLRVSACAGGGEASASARLVVSRFAIVESVDVNKLIDTIKFLELTAEERAARIKELNLTVSELATVMKSLELTAQEQAETIVVLELTIAERAELISQLELSLAEMGSVINNLRLNLDELTALMNALSLEVEGQLVIINNLNQNLELKKQLVSRLNATTQEQERLIAEMRGSFSEQADIIKQLNLTVQDDAKQITSFELSLEAQAAIIKELELSVEDQKSLVAELKLSNEEQKVLINQLLLTIEEKNEVIADLQEKQFTDLQKQFTDLTGRNVLPADRKSVV